MASVNTENKILIKPEQIQELRDTYMGSYVKILSGAFGMGNVQQGDKGIVVDVGIYGELVLNVMGDGNTFAGINGWNCLPIDVEVISKKAIANADIDRYIEFFKRRANIYASRRNTLIQEKENYERKLYDIADDISSMNTLIKSHQAKAGALNRDRIYNLYTVASEHFTTIKVVDNYLIGITKPIKMIFADYKDKQAKIDMGVYEVTIDICKNNGGGSGISFAHISGGTNILEVSNMHPHISSDGNACWGTWQNSLMKLYLEQDYISMLDLTYSFLCSADKNGWYINGYAFAKDANNRCRHCWEIAGTCSCEICGYCGEHMDNCECSTCPDSGDRLDSNMEYCDGCRHYGEDGCTY